jgi:hypothetical protein
MSENHNNKKSGGLSPAAFQHEVLIWPRYQNLTLTLANMKRPSWS